jgi:hypothetical protein
MASTTLSTSNCPMICTRLAPIAARTAISIARPLARASSRFAMLTHVISSTSSTAPVSISMPGRALPTTCSCNGTTRNPTFELNCG